MYPKRPKISESQEDLEILQSKFKEDKIKNGLKSSSNYVSCKPTEIGNEASTSRFMMGIDEKIANTFEAIPDNSNLKKIVERQPTNLFQQPIIKFNNNKGFPVVHKRDLNLKASSSGGSLFSRSIKNSICKENISKSHISTLEPNCSFLGSSEDSPEKQTIHLENMQKINLMTKEEINEEKDRLLSTLDPAIIQYLKSKKTKSSKHVPTMYEHNQAIQPIDINEIKAGNEVLNQFQSENWLNFDIVESNKLAWMKSMDSPIKIDKRLAYEARFDFNGWLLSNYNDGITEKNRILYHHGEEPNRPGYTLQELFQLSRSNITQQKIVALNSIAKLLALYSTGVYTDVLELPIEQIFFVLRFCLDDNTPSVLHASIKAMRNLFFNKIDETCLDAIFHFGNSIIQPILAVDDDEDDNTVNDQQTAETNLVKCLMRTGILTRIKYIINTVCPNNLKTITYCVDILVRLVRDSSLIVYKVYESDDLIGSIIRHFLPVAISTSDLKSPFGKPLQKVVKLLRLLAGRSFKIANDLVEKHKVMNSLVVYISSDNYLQNSTGIRLQSEVFLLWATFIEWDLTIDVFRSFTPVLQTFLNYHYQNTDFNMETTFARQEQVSAMFILLGAASKNLKLNVSYEILNICSIKWLTQFMDWESFSCGKLQIISALLSNQNPTIEHISLQLFISKAFTLVTSTLENTSMLLNNYETFKFTTNLKTLETAAWFTSEHVIPIMQTNSSLPFLNSLAIFVQKSENLQLKLVFLSHVNIENYLEKLALANNYFLTTNWFTRIETSFIMNLLKISVAIREHLDNPSRYYEVAVKTLNVFSVDQKKDIRFIFENIVFSNFFYSNEVSLQNLSLLEDSEPLETGLSNLGEILSVYTKVLNLETNILNKVMCIDLNLVNIIPTDWIYTPIIILYSKQQEHKEKVTESDTVFAIRNCLRWILIYDTYFPNLSHLIPVTDRFCRLACIFLGSDNLFLVPEIRKLLEKCARKLIKTCESEIDLNREIQGLANFQDFYIQLLEQYQGVSYGDPLFGNFILVPLAQRHSLKWRKTLWSEYSGIVQVFNLKEEDCFCSIESFLNPIEEDLSLLKCYRRALGLNSLRNQSILYKIAKYHIEAYVARKND